MKTIFGLLLIHITQVMASTSGWNGGHPYELEFYSTASDIHRTLRACSDFDGKSIHQDFSLSGMEQVVETMKLKHVRKKLKDKNKKEVAALNNPHLNTILISHKGWKAINLNYTLKSGIVSHEVLGLMELEKNHYRISNRLNDEYIRCLEFAKDQSFAHDEEVLARIINKEGLDEITFVKKGLDLSIRFTDQNGDSQELLELKRYYHILNGTFLKKIAKNQLKSSVGNYHLAAANELFNAAADAYSFCFETKNPYGNVTVDGKWKVAYILEDIFYTPASLFYVLTPATLPLCAVIPSLPAILGAVVAPLEMAYHELSKLYRGLFKYRDEKKLKRTMAKIQKGKKREFFVKPAVFRSYLNSIKQFNYQIPKQEL